MLWPSTTGFLLYFLSFCCLECVIISLLSLLYYINNFLQLHQHQNSSVRISIILIIFNAIDQSISQAMKQEQASSECWGYAKMKKRNLWHGLIWFFFFLPHINNKKQQWKYNNWPLLYIFPSFFSSSSNSRVIGTLLVSLNFSRKNFVCFPSRKKLHHKKKTSGNIK